MCVDTRLRRLQTEPAGVGPTRYDVHTDIRERKRERERETCLRRSPKNVLHTHTHTYTKIQTHSRREYIIKLCTCSRGGSGSIEQPPAGKRRESSRDWRTPPIGRVISPLPPPTTSRSRARYLNTNTCAHNNNK